MIYPASLLRIEGRVRCIVSPKTMVSYRRGIQAEEAAALLLIDATGDEY